MKLHLMSGGKILKGYTNIDKFNPKADVVSDVMDISYENGTIDTIYNCHGIEHLFYRDAVILLKRIRNWLRVGGTVQLSMPDLDWAMKKYVDHGLNLKRWQWWFYGIQENGVGWEHLSGWTPELLTRTLKENGWKEDEIVLRERKGSIIANLTKKYDS